MLRFHSALVLLVFLAGCSESSSNDAGSGGASGGAPSQATGGSTNAEAGATGGAMPGSGGAPAAAGRGGGGTSAGSGGAKASGGRASQAGAGGAITVGGADSSGGRITKGGSGGAAGNAGGAASGAGSGGDAGGSGGGAGAPAKCGPVTDVPAELRTRLNLDPFYKKHVDANGLSVLSSDAPDDEALIRACELLHNMLGKRDDVRQELIRRRARFVIIGKDEGTAEIPEYGYREKSQADIDYINQRARGLASNVASCGEENILCLKGDRYFDESICVHEFSHTIAMYGVSSADDSFEDALGEAFDAAMDSGILEDTYRTSNEQEYWAEGVQDWYDTNASADPPNGIHNSVDTRAELAEFDPELYSLIAGVFPEVTDWGDCHGDE